MSCTQKYILLPSSVNKSTNALVSHVQHRKLHAPIPLGFWNDWSDIGLYYTAREAVTNGENIDVQATLIWWNGQI